LKFHNITRGKAPCFYLTTATSPLRRPVANRRDDNHLHFAIIIDLSDFTAFNDLSICDIHNAKFHAHENKELLSRKKRVPAHEIKFPAQETSDANAM
jgi:hypothetical protein